MKESYLLVYHSKGPATESEHQARGVNRLKEVERELNRNCIQKITPCKGAVRSWPDGDSRRVYVYFELKTRGTRENSEYTRLLAKKVDSDEFSTSPLVRRFERVLQDRIHLDAWSALISCFGQLVGMKSQKGGAGVV